MLFKLWFQGASLKQIMFDVAHLWVRVEGINEALVFKRALKRLGKVMYFDQESLWITRHENISSGNDQGTNGKNPSPWFLL